MDELSPDDAPAATDDADENVRVAGVGSDGFLWGVRAVRGGGRFRKTVCAECPWRRDAEVGRFPAQAFRESASTSYDMAQRMFSCHMSGAAKPAVCAGFLLRNADHNLSVRVACVEGRYDPSEVSDGGADLYDNYREMAIANGVASDDPRLELSRANDE